MSIDFDVNKVLDQLGQFVAAKGPVAYDAAVNVVHYKAVADLVGGGTIGGLFTLIGATCLFQSLRTKKNRLTKAEKGIDEILAKVDALPGDYYQTRPGSRIHRDDLYNHLGINTREWTDNSNFTLRVVGCVCALLGLAILLGTVGDAWNWIALSHPDVALAKQLFERAMSTN